MNQNEAIIRQWFDGLWNKRQVRTMDELLAPDAPVHGLSDGGPAF